MTFMYLFLTKLEIGYSILKSTRQKQLVILNADKKTTKKS